MDFSPGETVVAHDGQVGTVLAPRGRRRGYLEYTYPVGHGDRIVKAHAVLLDGGEVRVYAAWALTRPGTQDSDGHTA